MATQAARFDTGRAAEAPGERVIHSSLALRISLTGYTFGNGQTASTTFDTRTRPAHWVNGPLDLTYNYDDVGNVTSISDARGSSQSSTFTYDALDRLTGVTGFAARTCILTCAGVSCL